MSRNLILYLTLKVNLAIGNRESRSSTENGPSEQTKGQLERTALKSDQYTGPGQVLAQFFLVDPKLTLAYQSDHYGLFLYLI